MAKVRKLSLFLFLFVFWGQINGSLLLVIIIFLFSKFLVQKNCKHYIKFTNLLVKLKREWDYLVLIVTHSKRGRSDVRCEILLERPTRSKLVAWGNLPEPYRRLIADPAVHLQIFVLTWVLILVINLRCMLNFLKLITHSWLVASYFSHKILLENSYRYYDKFFFQLIIKIHRKWYIIKHMS